MSAAPTEAHRAAALAIRTRRRRTRRRAVGLLAVLALAGFVAASILVIPRLTALDTAVRFCQAFNGADPDASYRLIDDDLAVRIARSEFSAWTAAGSHWLTSAGWEGADLTSARLTYRLRGGIGVLLEDHGETAFCPATVVTTGNTAVVEIQLDAASDGTVVVCDLVRSGIGWRIAGADVAGTQLFGTGAAR